MEVVGYDPLWREKKKSVIGDKKTVSKEDLEKIDKLLEYTITDTTGQRHQIIFFVNWPGIPPVHSVF